MKKIIAFLFVMIVSMVCVGGAMADSDPDRNWKEDMAISNEVGQPAAPLTAEQKADMKTEAGAGYVSPQAMSEGREPAKRPAPMSAEEKADMKTEAGAGYVSPQEMAKSRRS